MTRGDRHRLLDMQEVVSDLRQIVARGKEAFDGRLRDVYIHSYHRVDFDLMWAQLVTQLPDLSAALAEVEPPTAQ